MGNVRESSWLKQINYGNALTIKRKSVIAVKKANMVGLGLDDGVGTHAVVSAFYYWSHFGHDYL